eukprot:CAMPEP_0182481750 /NCGR_PEP_ID=MMETSP1319-20130603/37848_1 /TAXON_ID=172717 /ORGANISM="Bolidomonas pacifica, Strain RCC208" /LENGTH=55 /DNA_ID=CAMNT_0024683381 /DNA_START=111 /DNA_END=275 /DNA_ORIENTATION=+
MYEEGTVEGHLGGRKRGRYVVVFEDEEKAKKGGYDLQTQLWPRPFTLVRKESAKE